MSMPPDLQQMVLLEEIGRLKKQLDARDQTIRELVADTQRANQTWLRERTRLETTIAAMRGTDLPGGRAARRKFEKNAAAAQRAEAQRAKRHPKHEASGQQDPP